MLKRGLAVCGGFASFEQHLAQSFPAEFGIRCLKADGYSRSTTNLGTSGAVDHSWLVYSFGDSGLWAPSDPTVTSNRIREIAKKGRSFVDRAPFAMMVAVDPRLRDAFHVLRFPAGYEQAYVFPRAKGVKMADFDVTTLESWKRLSETNPAACSETLALVR